MNPFSQFVNPFPQQLPRNPLARPMTSDLDPTLTAPPEALSTDRQSEEPEPLTESSPAPAAALDLPSPEPMAESAEPAESVAEPAESMAEPAESVAEPAESVAEPAESVAEPIPEAIAEPPIFRTTRPDEAETLDDRIAPEDLTPPEPSPPPEFGSLTEPDITEPDITEPDVTAPDVTAPDITAPDITAPDITEPNAASPEISAPIAPAQVPAESLATQSTEAIAAAPLPLSESSSESSGNSGGNGGGLLPKSKVEPYPEPEPYPKTDSELVDDVEMSLFDHLEELRERIFWSLGGIVGGVILCFARVKPLVKFLEQPAQGVKFLQLSPGEFFFVSIKVAAYSGIIIASPIILYQIVRFVLPGLTKRERRFLAPIVLGSGVLFFAGLAFAYYALIPAALQFFMSYGAEVVEQMWSIDRYFEFVLLLMFSTGLAFQVPVLQMILGLVGIVTAKQMLSAWRYVVLAAAVAGAVLTPSTDPLTQSLLAGAVTSLYLGGAGMVALITRAK